MKSTIRLTIGFVLMTLTALGPLSAQRNKTAVEGIVVDSTGRVLMGADVFFRDMSSGLEIHQVTDNKGGFRFLAKPGSYQVTAARSGFDSTTHDLTLTQAGGADLRLELSPAAVSTQVVDRAALHGEVVDLQGQRIVGAAVVVVLDTGEVRETTSDARGEFRVEAIPGGSHTVTVASPGFEARTIQVDVGEASDTALSVALEIIAMIAQVTVTAPSPDGYAAPRAAAATRLNIPVIETPFSVQVVPKRVMEDQNALGLEEVYANVSGVAESGNTLNAQTEIRPIIRGFEAAVLLRNGLRATTVGAIDLVNIESVEVLKGPASILYGALEPGGVLNYTTKKPLMAPRYEVSQQFGSYGHSRTTLDASGPLNEDRTVAYRINTAYQDSGSFRNSLDLDRLVFIPSMVFRPDDRNELFVDFSYSRERMPYDSGVPFGLDGEPLVPTETFFGDPSLDGRNLQDYFSSIGYLRSLRDNLMVRTQFQFHRIHALNESIRHRGVRGSAGSEVLRRRYQNEDRTDDDYQFVADVISTFDLGATSHQALVGFDLAYQDSTFLRYRQNLPNLQITATPQVRFTPPAIQPQQTILGTNRWAAFYFQDQITTLENDRLKLLVGGRYDTFRGEGTRDDVVQSPTEGGKFTGRIGAGYTVVPSTLAFASVSQSFLPQRAGTVDTSGRLLDPQTGLQYEGGFKFELFDGRLSTTASVYHIRKDDVPVFNFPLFLETGARTYFPGVAERSRGVEFDIAGRVTDGWSLIANHSYNDAETVENSADPSEVGQQLGNTPTHLSRIWAAYEVPEGRQLAGSGFGLGVRAQDEQRAPFDTLVLDGYAVVDLGLWYRLRVNEAGQRLRFQVNIDNLLDKEYYIRASDRSIVHPGAPLSATASVGYEF